jgi:diguanylate cyclase (GGDEF)-like protein
MYFSNTLTYSVFRAETADYLIKKFEDHRSFSVFTFVLATVLGPSLWLWDYVTDPGGAQNTLFLRLLYLGFIVFVWAFRRSDRYLLLALTSMSAMLVGEAIFICILNRLHDGMTYGSGGFLVFMYAPLMLFTGFSLRINLCYLLCAGALPQFLALAGMAPGFQHAHYAILIWPTVVVMAATAYAAAHNYYRRYQSEAALAQASNTDALTGARNRRYFLPRTKQEIFRAQRTHAKVSLLMLDIDNFKRINDTYGHPTGDMVLCHLVTICSAQSREMDVVARLGGEEFGILLPETTLQEAGVLAERIRGAVAATQLTSLGGTRFGFTVSIGVAEQPAGDLSEEHLLALADTTLYEAKRAGRNRIGLPQAAAE